MKKVAGATGGKKKSLACFSKSIWKLMETGKILRRIRLVED
ncbi:Hypothetical protein, conserved [Brucella ceti str. Cudo]|uniref:Uncharacterized protein n=1 Tax=Brucella ceti str. Cudo TaxID=595497 RepID=C0G7B5_9HYPH|nr:Hypothetical protein, conserved [Brucella ceti str. Cudo]